MWDGELAPRVFVEWVNNDTLSAQAIEVFDKDGPAIDFQPNEKGYTLVASCLCLPDAPAPAGKAFLRLLSDRPLVSAVVEPSTAVADYSGTVAQVFTSAVFYDASSAVTDLGRLHF